MKIQYDKPGPGVTYPIDAKLAKRLLQSKVPEKVLDAITKVRFGCNRKTAQEARIVGRGPTYEIRINFFLTDSKTKMLSKQRDWVRIVERCGGVVNTKTSEISWSADAARRYAIFLLFHEVGHAVYAQERGLGMLHSSTTSSEEERWCDAYGLKAVAAVSKDP